MISSRVVTCSMALGMAMLLAASCATDPVAQSHAGSSNPVRISGENPGYPQAARRFGVEGRVVAWLHVDVDGNVTSVTIKESPSSLLSDEAISAFQKWKFRPPYKDGKPIPFIGEYQVVFRLTDPLPSINQT